MGSILAATTDSAALPWAVLPWAVLPWAVLPWAVLPWAALIRLGPRGSLAVGPPASRPVRASVSHSRHRRYRPAPGTLPRSRRLCSILGRVRRAGAAAHNQ